MARGFPVPTSLAAGFAVASVGLGACGGSSDEPGARVTEVIDGDTVEMERLGRVRLIGVDIPEEGRCYENAATRFTRDRLEGKVVQYELGEERQDRYDRTLAYLSREGDMHNLALLEEGYATALTIPPNDKYADDFEEAEREARTRDEGLWDTCDRNRRRARQAAARRRAEAGQARRIAARQRERARQARRAARDLARQEARRERAAARESAQQAREEALAPPEPVAVPDDDNGGGGGTCLPSSACPGRRDGDGDGCYCEG